MKAIVHVYVKDHSRNFENVFGILRDMGLSASVEPGGRDEWCLETTIEKDLKSDIDSLYKKIEKIEGVQKTEIEFV